MLEILANEMAQRKLREAEVKMELKREREEGMSKGDHKVQSFMAFSERSTAPKSTLPADMKTLEAIISKIIDEKLAAWLPRLQKLDAAVVAPTVEKEASDLPTKVDQILFKAKPKDEVKLSGVKHEMEEAEEVQAVLKKARREWSCELCQTKATSEGMLELHYQGKKHKSKLAALAAKANVAKALLPSETCKGESCEEA